MMKIAVICNTDSLALPALNLLHKKGFTLEVGILEKHASALMGSVLSIGIDRKHVQVLNMQHWKESIKTWLEKLKPDMAWVFAFPWRIPSFILDIPAKGFFNFHFGTLPKYKGADPIFWQIKNGEQKSDLTIHRMTEKIDEGPVMLQYEMPMIPGENYGLLCNRMGALATGAVEKFLVQQESGALPHQPQEASDALFYKKPDTAQLKINWKEQTAEEIETLVNACNPRYGGATTFIRNMEMRILEVTYVDLADAAHYEPGMIVHADAVYGLIVSCREQKFLRLNVVHMAEGYFSGIKLFSMGIGKGEKFE